MKPTFRFYLTLAALFLVSACANTYDRIETGGTDRTSSRLDSSVAVLVTTPKDGGYAGKIYKGSGATAARRIDAAFSREARLVDVYPSEYHSLDELKDVIAKHDYGYIVIPTLTVWGRTDKTSPKAPNQVSVKVSIIDAATGEEISSNSLEAKGASPSSLSSLFSSNLGPDELLLNATDDYVDDLYGVILPRL